MKIAEFIQGEILLPRVKKIGVLVVYDPDRRYRELCLAMASATLRVVDASESSIISRDQAMKALLSLGRPRTEIEGLLVYVPARAPLNDEDRQIDPFALYAVCGGIFPDGDGDEYMSICLRAKPDYATEIRRIFAETPSPAFAVIDAVGSAAGWPNLQALLKQESTRDLLFSLLAPSDSQKHALKGQDAWVSEAKTLFATCLGLKLITRGKTWEAIGDELWRFLLFSEFVFDVKDPLPESLSNVPCAVAEAKSLVEDLCDRLRNDRRTQSIYIDRATSIERELELPAHCKMLKSLGYRDTFPFEEQASLGLVVEGLVRGEVDVVRSILERQRGSVWLGVGESQARWGIVGAALAHCEACEDYERQLPEHSGSLEGLIEFYLGSLREVDRLHREFEQTVSDLIDGHSMMAGIIEKARARYSRLSSRVQDVFTRHLERSGWPPLERLANADVFDKLIASKLRESGRKVAFILVDALRYELGVVLSKQLAEDDKVELMPAFAQLPSITSMGMASLLPEAGKALQILRQDNASIPALGTKRLANVSQRMDVLRQRYGHRFAEMTLGDFLQTKKILNAEVELLLIRSTEIDSHLETVPDTALRSIYDTLKRIRVAIHKLKDSAFHDVVIAADHGFFLNTHAEAGDVCSKPPGNWVVVHDRFLLGNGSADAANWVLPAEKLGIRGDFAQAGGPRSLVSYRAGQPYFHGGVSLQECIVPVISLRLGERAPQPLKPVVRLGYRAGAKRITTRLPVVDLLFEAIQIGLFHPEEELEVLIEAHDKKGQVVGEAKAGGPINPVTGTLTLKPGQPTQVTLKMLLDFEGKFTVKALNPTTLSTYDKLDLETDYVV